MFGCYDHIKTLFTFKLQKLRLDNTKITFSNSNNNNNNNNNNIIVTIIIIINGTM